ncbi:AMP-binding protein [Streptomyces virginiae]|uniref:AMP-binding protein n=1 Tax=Streptomyces virginiae TaxID=1961 RepID=UPI0036E9436C
MDHPRTLHSWFTDSAARVPDEPALVLAGRGLSYRRLAALSRYTAGALVRTVGGRPARVGLLSSRTVAAYAGYLGILGAGGIVVPLNEGYPAERNRRVLELAGLDAVIADPGQDTAFAEGAGVPVLRLAAEELDRVPDRVDGPWRPGDPEDVAYVLFTSGSTGVPKGVPVRHRNLDAFLRHHIDRYAVGPGCRASQTFGLTFDPSVFDMFVTWGGGATLVVPTREDLLDPVAFVRGNGLTHWYSVPSIISLVRTAGGLRPGSMPSLRHSLFAGEQLTLEQAEFWGAAAPGSTIENLYGPTELSVTVTAYRLPSDRSRWPVTSNATVPIGRVYGHLDHRVDPDTGELWVRGPQRFDGYLDPADNAGRFAPPGSEEDTGAGTGEDDGSDVPPGPRHWYRTGDRVTVEDGELVHMGRLDHQVKIMGQRLELGDVESAVRRWGGLDDVVVVAVPGAGGEARLTAVYSGAETSSAELRGRLRGRLPAHMLPKRFVYRPTLPLNPNGKVDRAACAQF